MSQRTTLDQLEDMREFRRLRNYYRRNFTNGESDETFVLWCEEMCKRERRERREVDPEAG